jgi:hypothetical protein
LILVTFAARGVGCDRDGGGDLTGVVPAEDEGETVTVLKSIP